MPLEQPSGTIDPIVSIDVDDGNIVFGGTASYSGSVTGAPSIVEGPTGDQDGILFGGGSDSARLGDGGVGDGGVGTDGSWTIDCYFKTPIPGTAAWHTLTRGAAGDHQIIIHMDQTSLGSFDNIGGSGFTDTGFDVATLPDGWHRLTVSAGGGSATFFIDGTEVGAHSTVSSSDVSVWRASLIWVRTCVCFSSPLIQCVFVDVQFFAIGNYQRGNQQWGYLSRFRIYDGMHSPDELVQGELETDTLLSTRTPEPERVLP